VVLTAAGLVLLVHAGGRFLADRRAEYVRETDRFARSVSPAKFSGETRSVFHWSPRQGLLDSFRLPSPLASALGSTNVLWQAEGHKARPPKIGVMELAGCIVAWRRLPDGTVAGGVVESFSETTAIPWASLFAVGSVLVLFLVGVIFVGGYGLLRGLERERRENAEKTSFLANATHELKTPLAAIRLWSEMLASERLKPDRARHAAEVIEEENSRMIRLVENLLDFSRLEQSRRRYREEDADVRRIVEDAVDLLRADFSEHGISVGGDESVPARVDVDAVRQILLNLLGNAAKYAAAGGPVEVEVVRRGGRIVASVSDRGPGMAPADMARAFERFFRGAGASDAPGGGMGLGLAISRGLARGMGGELSAAPRPGGGCIFTLEMPARNAV